VTSLKQEYKTKGAVQHWKDIDYDKPFTKASSEDIYAYHKELQSRKK